MIDVKSMKPSAKLIATHILGLTCWVGLAWSSTFRPMPLSTLVQRSASVVVATPVSFESHWAIMGATSRLVTDVTLEVAWTLRGRDTTGQDIVVRTLGGTVGDIAQIVYGEARFSVGQTSLLFLVPGHEGTWHVLGMAQGHYPLEPNGDGDWRLRQSPGLEGVLKPELSAAQALSGQRLLDVPSLLKAQEVAP